MSTLLKFDKLSNTRDLGGMRTEDGRTIVPGKLIRSGQLYDITESDIRKLSELVDTVVDLRTEEEKREALKEVDARIRRMMLAAITI